MKKRTLLQLNFQRTDSNMKSRASCHIKSMRIGFDKLIPVLNDRRFSESKKSKGCLTAQLNTTREWLEATRQPSTSKATRSRTINKRNLNLSMDSKIKVKNTKIKPSRSLMSLRDASQLKGWKDAAKPELSKIWCKMINKSNGVSPDYFGTFKFFVGRGNNSQLITKLMKARKDWRQTEEIREANFIWTQCKDEDVIETLGRREEEHKVLKETRKETICPIKAKIGFSEFRGVDISSLGYDCIQNSEYYCCLEEKEIISVKQKCYNKIKSNELLTNKKGLYATMKEFYLTSIENWPDFMPLTFHVTGNDQEFSEFERVFTEFEEKRAKFHRFKNLWIVKPAENSNRGQGIILCSTIQEIEEKIKKLTESRTLIIQKYIEHPFLIHKRKFDIRCYCLLTCTNGVFQAYFYKEGYLRTSSTEFSLRNLSAYVHLTNDAIQKHSFNYGKYEKGNKLSYKDFERYLQFHCSSKKLDFSGTIIPKIKEIVQQTVQALHLRLSDKPVNTFELLGYDFMIDSAYKPWLIEVNTNPCLATSSPYLEILIPQLLDNVFRIAIDPLFTQNESMAENKFELIFHSNKESSS